MRFVCDSCRAQYMISDDKVGPKGVKVRCKKCGHTITVRPAGAGAGKDSSLEPATSSSASVDASTPKKEADSSATSSVPATLGTPPEGGLFTDVEEDEIGAVFDQVLSSGTHKIPSGEALGEAAAREATAENVRKLAEAEAEPDKEEAAKPAVSHDWYVAIDEKQVGPLSVEKVKDAWDRGEVGPDSLCWRSGFSDWIPLSETAELASVLAPRPSKPTIVAPEPVSGSQPTVQSGPVQSAFSAGKSSKGDSVLAASSEAPAGWKPSAASVLASLVKEENDAFAKPPPTPAPALGREPVSQSRLLDVPMPPPEPVSSPSLMGAGAAMAAPQVPQGFPQQPMAPYGQPAPYGQQPYAQPVPAPYAAPPGYSPVYAQPAPAPAGGKGRMGLMVGIAVGVLGLGAGVFAMTRGDSRAETPSTTQVAAQPVAVAPPPPATPQPQAVVAPPPVTPQPVAAAVPPPPTEGTAGAQTPPVAGAAQVANQAGTAGTPAGSATPPPVVSAAVAPPPAVPQPPAETAKPADNAVAKAEKSTTTRRSPVSTTSVGRREEPETRQVRAEKPPPDGDSDDFDELFGTKKPKSEPKQTETTRTAYIPPEPGGGGVPDTLQRSDIMEVVLNNKPAIVKCVNEQKKKDPMLSGKLVMRWTIQTSGKTSSVTCKTDEFKSTYMASCISGLIKGWAFPKHKKQGEPIDFPFTF